MGEEWGYNGALGAEPPCPTLTWALLSVLLGVDLALRVLVMLKGNSPNLEDQGEGV